MTQKFAEVLVEAWYRKAWWLWLFWPLSFLFSLLAGLRKSFFATGLQAEHSSELPVVVVGNITVGGAGKSPLVAALVRGFRAQGLRPGIVSRGYGATRPIARPILINDETTVDEVGDEPLMLYRQLNCPICVCPKRAAAVSALSSQDCDIIISDDGLQHYEMARDVEICVFDAKRMWGNGLLLPAGPLREPKARLSSVDFIVVNGQADPAIIQRLNKFPGQTIEMRLSASGLLEVSSQKRLDLSFLAGKEVSAVAGIGNPQRFFDTLEQCGAEIVETRVFEDHHPFTEGDFSGLENRTLVMTEKDAVKCQDLELTRAYYLSVEAQLSDTLVEQIIELLKRSHRLSKH